MKKHDTSFYIKRRKHKVSSLSSLFVKMIATFTVFLIVPMILLGIIWYSEIQKASLKQAKELGRKNVTAIAEQIELYRAAIAEDLLNMLYGSRLQTYRTYGRPEDLVGVMRDMEAVKAKNSVVVSIYLHDIENEKIFDTYTGMHMQDVFYDIGWLELMEDMNMVQILQRYSHINKELQDAVSGLAATIYKERQVITLISPEESGFRLVANIDVQSLGEWLKSRFYTEDKKIYIASQNGILYTSSKEEVDEEELDVSRWSKGNNYYEYYGKEDLYFAAEIEGTQLYYIEAVSMEMEKSKTEGYAVYVFGVIAIMAAILVVLAVYVTGRTYRPYHDLFSRIQNVKEDELPEESTTKEWYGIKKIFRRISAGTEEEMESRRMKGFENSSMLRMLLSGITSQEYFLNQVKESLVEDFLEKKAQIVVCKLSDEYLATDRKEYNKHKLNEVINVYLQEYKEGISAETDYNILTLFLVNDAEEDFEKKEEFLRSMINELTDYYNYFYSSEIFQSGELICHYYRQCLNKAENALFFEGYSYTENEVCGTYKSEYNYSGMMGYATPIIKSIVMGEEQVILDTMDALEKELIEVGRKDYAQNLCARILSEIDKELAIGHILTTDKDIIRRVYDIRTLKDLKESMSSVFIKKLNSLKCIDKSVEEKYYEKAILYMHENYMKNISITDVADEIGISYVYLSKIFKIYQKNGVRMIDYLNMLRINKAMDLLEVTNDTLTEIAEKTGYNNVQSLTRFFKKYKGITPGDYRKNIMV